MKKTILGLFLGLAFSQIAMAESAPEKQNHKNEYHFQVLSGSKVVVEFRQKVSFLDLENSDFEKLETNTYYEFCNRPGGKEITVQEGATGLVVVDEEAGLEQLNLSVQINTAKRAGKCQKPEMETVDVAISFPMIQTALKVEGSLGNSYVVTAARIQLDKDGNETIPKVNSEFK